MVVVSGPRIDGAVAVDQKKKETPPAQAAESSPPAPTPPAGDTFTASDPIGLAAGDAGEPSDPGTAETGTATQPPAPPPDGSRENGNSINTDRGFVETLYTDALGRNPDDPFFSPDYEGGNAGPLFHLDRNVSARQLAKDVFGSPEYAAQNNATGETVDRLYRSVLGREPDPGGRENLINALDSGMTVNQAIDNLFDSPEYQTRANTGELIAADRDLQNPAPPENPTEAPGVAADTTETAPPAEPPAPETYTIVSGDTLTGIGAKYGVPWQEIYEANKDIVGDNPDLIFPGQTLTIPGQTAEPPAGDPAEAPDTQAYFQQLATAIESRDHEALAALVPDEAQRQLLYEEQGIPPAPAAEGETPPPADVAPGNPNLINAFIIDSFTTGEDGFNHGEAIQNTILNGGGDPETVGQVRNVNLHIGEGAIAEGLSAIDINAGVEGDFNDRTDRISAAFDEIIRRAEAGEDIDVVNVSQYFPGRFEEAATEAIRAQVDRLENEFGIPVVIAAGNNGPLSDPNILATEDSIVVSNIENGAIDPRSGPGNVLVDGANPFGSNSTSFATANLSNIVGRLHNEGNGFGQIRQILNGGSAPVPGGGAANNPIAQLLALLNQLGGQ